MSESALTLHIGCGAYDRTRPLIDGDVSVDGISLDWSVLPIEQTIERMLREQAFDVSEMSLAAAYVTRDMPTPPLVLLPVFPSRYFRHSCIFVNASAGIETPEDLIGKRVGLANYYRMAAAVWVRGFLEHDFGVSQTDVQWVSAEVGRPGQADGIEVDLPSGISIEPVPLGDRLDAMLERGAIDALVAVRMPESFAKGSANVRRLFPDPRYAEADYFRRTGIFPPMHVLAVRREVYRNHPWIAEPLCEAFEHAKRLNRRRMYEIDTSFTSLAWFIQHFEEERQILGDDPWAYGMEANHHVLATFAEHCYEQGITSHALSMDELFGEVPWSPRPDRFEFGTAVGEPDGRTPAYRARRG